MVGCQTCDNLVEEEVRNYFKSFVEGFIGFGPFVKVIYSDNDLLVTTTRGWSTLFEINSPLVEGAFVMIGWRGAGGALLLVA